MSESDVAFTTSEINVALGTAKVHRRVHRMGKFRIAQTIIKDRPDLARIVLRDCIVVRAETLYHTDAIEYVAEHPDFDESNVGDELHEYRAIITESSTGDLRVYRRRWE